MALFPQFPYSNLHELNLDWLIEKISQLLENGTVISVNGLSGVVTLYTEKDVVFPDRAFDPDWSVYRRIAEKHAGLQFTGEKFYYITKNVDDDDFTIQEVYTSGNLPPFPVTSVNGQTGNVVIAIPVTSVNGRTGEVVLAGDNIPYNIDGSYTIEDIIVPLEKSIGHVIRYNTCSDGVTAGQYVYLILSGISGRSDGLYKAVNAKSAGSVWTASDLSPVAGGLGALMAQNDSAIATLTDNITWKNAGLVTGNTVLQLPTTNWKELYLVFYVFGDAKLGIPLTISKNNNREEHYTAIGYLSQTEIDAHGWSLSPCLLWADLYVYNSDLVILATNSEISLPNWQMRCYYR